jgi:hypothetical protein
MPFFRDHRQEGSWTARPTPLPTSASCLSRKQSARAPECTFAAEPDPDLPTNILKCVINDVLHAPSGGHHPDGPVLRLTPDEWAAFLAGVRNGEFG